MDNISWKLIDKYFTENPNNLVAHHLESYNDFFNGGIHSIFRENNPIRFVQRADDVDKPSEAHLYLGGKDGSKIYFGKPIIYDDRKTHYMYPNDARLRNMTYGVTVHYDVDVVFVTYDDKGTRNEETMTLPDKIYLGRFPIMLQSDLCILKSLSKEVRFNMGECKNDYGGYFIIDGKEKVIVSQEKFANNTLYIAKKKDDDEFSHSAEIRSVSEDASKPIRTTAVKIVAPGAKYTNNQIVVAIPNVRKPIPLFILMRALGVVSDKDIIRVCLLDLDKNSDMVDLFIPSVHDASRIFNQETALEFIATFTKRATISSVVEILSDFFLPHIGEINFMEKAYFVGYMVNRLLKVFTNQDKPTDRDNFRFKRVELTGSLLYDLFREYYLIQCHAIALKVDRMYTLHKGQYKDNVVSLIQDNYRDFFKDRDVEAGLRKAFKGNWGSQTHTKRLGVVQDLNRLSWNTFISHLRKINLPLDASAKVVGPRHLNGSQWGFIDPLDTPDGGNIGLHKHLAISTQITSGSSAFPMIKWIRRNIAMRLVLECSPEYLMSSSKIFVNGNWIGVTDNPLLMVDQMKLFRRNGILPVFTSISFDYEHNEVYVYTDSGRLTRPLYYVQNEKPSFDRKQVKDLLDSGKITWSEIVAGFKTKKDENYSIKNNKIYNVAELYGAGSAEDMMRDFKTHQSVVDYLDTAEEESSLIATTPDDLKKTRFYTHMEIDPSLLLGVMGNQIIYPENNPFARNSFSCGQSKQAVSLYHSNYQMRIDKMGVILNSGQIPLIKSRYMDYINSESQPYGVNAIVAIMSYTGYNVEDAILINQGSVNRGIFRTTYYSMYEAREENASISGSTNSKFANVQNSNVQKKKAGYDYDQLDDNGLIKENTVLNDKTILIGKVTSDVENPDILIDDSVKPKKGQLGFVDKSFVTQGEEGTNIAKVRVREERIPAQGDKMASRAGQKGTIGLIISEEDMPFTADGIKPDLIINPHALPSRMTIGQIVESLLGVLCTHYGAFGDCTAFQTKGANYQTYAPLLVKAGFNSTGNQVMYNGMTGEQLEADIFIGPTYYMRLKHMVKDKINYRARGPNTMLTRQPVQGRANDGGLRIGEMERDGVMAHGMSFFLNESFMVRGDEYYMAICNKTGATAIYNEAKSLFLSPFADGPINFNINHDGTMNIKNLSKFGRSFSIVRIPYSLKLLLQELQVMNVHMRVITDANVDQLMNLSYSMNVHKLMNDDGTDTSELINKLKNKFAKDKAPNKIRIASNSKSSESWDTKEGELDFSPETPDEGTESPAYPTVVYPYTETKATIAIITLFRDNDKGARERQRKEFIRRMNRIMAPYRYHIFIIEQSADGDPFNIGKLKNVGFKIAGEWEKTHDMKFTNFIFSDIDMIPDDELLQYYVKPIKKPLSLAIRGTRYDQRDMESKKIFLGAVLGFNRRDFEEINGYPDNFWGWGGEDDALLYRLVASDVGTVQIPKVGAVIDLEDKKTIAEKLESVVKDNQRWEKLYIDLTHWKKNGLSNLNYKLLKMTDEAENTTQYLVDLVKKEDEQKYPELFKTEGLKFDWKKDRRVITDKYDKLRVEILDFAQQTQSSDDSFEVKPYEPVRFGTDTPSPVYIPQQSSSSSVPYAPPLFTQKEKAYYYEDLSKPPIICEIDEINADGTYEVMDLSDGRIIRTRVENLGKIFQPAQTQMAGAPLVGAQPNGSQPVVSQPGEPLEKVSIFGVEEEKADEEKEEEKDKDKNDGEKKIIINIKPE
jgi:DNA-directed RNA polymerase II subunit RPB2